ncbi:MAG: hypothetical protein ACR2KE_04630 [Candidatus Nanopelagicales bacterium]
MAVIVVHGAGSAGVAARSLLEGWLAQESDVVLLEDRSGDVERVIAALDRHVDSLHRRPLTVAGVSMGAHAVARWAARRPSAAAALVLALPAWRGAPSVVAAATRASAEQVSALGAPAALDHARASAPADAAFAMSLLALGWDAYEPGTLAPALHAAALGHGPTDADLRRVPTPCVVAGWTGDALHPESEARAWAAGIPGANLVLVPWAEANSDPQAFGWAVSAALASA